MFFISYSSSLSCFSTSGIALLFIFCASRSCDCTHPIPFFRSALLPLTCVLGNFPFMKIPIHNNAMHIATINTVKCQIYLSISEPYSKFAEQI